VAEVFPATINPEKADLNAVAPAYAGGNCTVYCHGVNLPLSGAGGGGCDTSPSWADSGYLSGSPGDNDSCVTPGDCEQCHGSPPLAVTAHDGTETLSGVNGCFNCHDHFNDGGSLNNASLHIDGTVQAQADCDSCHEYPPYPGDSKSYQAVEGKGAHVVHVNYLTSLLGVTLDPANDTYGSGTAGEVCGVCHTNTVANHRDASRLINFGDNGNTQTVAVRPART
jgi:hypothetical protein